MSPACGAFFGARYRETSRLITFACCGCDCGWWYERDDVRLATDAARPGATDAWRGACAGGKDCVRKSAARSSSIGGGLSSSKPSNDDPEWLKNDVDGLMRRVDRSASVHSHPHIPTFIRQSRIQSERAMAFIETYATMRSMPCASARGRESRPSDFGASPSPCTCPSGGPRCR